jgi:hypothetical protein
MENIRAEIRALEPQTLTNVMNNAIERARLCKLPKTDSRNQHKAGTRGSAFYLLHAGFLLG